MVSNRIHYDPRRVVLYRATARGFKSPTLMSLYPLLEVHDGCVLLMLPT